MAVTIARDSPDLADLSAEDLRSLARVVVAKRLGENLSRQADLASINYDREKELFIATVGQSDSPYTRKTYTGALNRLEGWARSYNVSILEMKPREADNFAYVIRAEGRAPNTIRCDLAVASSFFTFMERRYPEAVKNPFRGTRARPPKQAIKETVVPSYEEIETIMSVLPKSIAAAVAVMAYNGLRVGAIPLMHVRGTRYLTRSKGKDIEGDLAPEAITRIEDAGLLWRVPFGEDSATKIADTFRYYVKRLEKEDRVQNSYSVHDLRHAFAIKVYKEGHDIYRVSKLLGHANIQVTETYLRGLGEVD